MLPVHHKVSCNKMQACLRRRDSFLLGSILYGTSDSGREGLFLFPNYALDKELPFVTCALHSPSESGF
jgi:hypothetical protein